MKAPRSWPNSSLSIRFSGSAAQLIGTKGKALREECSCSARASSSFPVPVSPSTSTGRDDSAARSSVPSIRCVAGSPVTKPCIGSWRRRRTRSATFSRRRRAFSAAFCTSTLSSSSCGGFAT